MIESFSVGFVPTLRELLCPDTASRNGPYTRAFNAEPDFVTAACVPGRALDNVVFALAFEQAFALLYRRPVARDDGLVLEFLQCRRTGAAGEDHQHDCAGQPHVSFDHVSQVVFPTASCQVSIGRRVVYLTRRSTNVELAERTAECLRIWAFRNWL